MEILTDERPKKKAPIFFQRQWMDYIGSKGDMQCEPAYDKDVGVGSLYIHQKKFDARLPKGTGGEYWDGY